ncbi:competence type IV pilus minor pilin ComGE [Bacillus sp. 179-C3.3 HS]|uniref:competence type IV pilus minor pilin ComGE n=1 Tax=Bacillus sp. 179-C3.3 HS TaxID=3232162 RepID=UPI0039A1ECD7
MFRNSKGFSTIDVLFACQLFLFTALILIPTYEKLLIEKKELRARLDAYQVLHEQMNIALMTGKKQSVKMKRGEIVYVFKWDQQKGCVLYKLQKRQTVCLRG